jgi:hypothetical protein
MLSRLTFPQLARCFPWEVQHPLEVPVQNESTVGVNLVEIANEVTEVNEMNGWTIDLSNKLELGMKFALCASEASEACEEFEVGQVGENGEPVPTAEWVKRMQIEFADVVIRVLHLMRKLEMNPQLAYYNITGLTRVGVHKVERDLRLFSMEHFYAQVMRLVVMPSFRLMEAYRKPETPNAQEMQREFGRLIVDCEALCDKLDPANRMWSIVAAKLEKNRARGFKHGNKAF